jgi:hypothetical protein
LGHNLWRFVSIQQQVEKLRDDCDRIPPMQRGELQTSMLKANRSSSGGSRKVSLIVRDGRRSWGARLDVAHLHPLSDEA